ncbi:hypothetical protein AVEN_121474-1 [Araneus ventricosus]|uniref:Uncharacterized protein n=1 Tax=Araneus ventricosus TaxID=182803 RepID=A0A4Y2NXB4_ARAVE|nr:hypothetical protein AVEN_121474-1 [Araneus ventricosus]
MVQRGEEIESTALLEHVLFGGGRTFQTDKGSWINRFSNRFTRETEPLRGLNPRRSEKKLTYPMPSHPRIRDVNSRRGASLN